MLKDEQEIEERRRVIESDFLGTWVQTLTITGCGHDALIVKFHGHGPISLWQPEEL